MQVFYSVWDGARGRHPGSCSWGAEKELNYITQLTPVEGTDRALQSSRHPKAGGRKDNQLRTRGLGGHSPLRPFPLSCEWPQSRWRQSTPFWGLPPVFTAWSTEGGRRMLTETTEEPLVLCNHICLLHCLLEAPSVEMLKGLILGTTIYP